MKIDVSSCNSLRSCSRCPFYGKFLIKFLTFSFYDLHLWNFTHAFNIRKQNIWAWVEFFSVFRTHFRSIWSRLWARFQNVPCALQFHQNSHSRTIFLSRQWTNEGYLLKSFHFDSVPDNTKDCTKNWSMSENHAFF